MSPALLKLYHSLCPSLRNVAASVRGLQLQHLRYGRETDRLSREALGREGWTPTQWQDWQQSRLSEILEYAVTRVPFYRELWAKRRRLGDMRTWKTLSNWPILSKQQLRQNQRAFLSDDCIPRALFYDQTSGTSGTPLKVFFSKETARQWYAVYETRLRNWNNVGRHDRWAILGGQQVVPPRARKAPYWVHNFPMRQLYLSANHISAASAPSYCTAISSFGATHLIAYPSSATALARELLGAGLKCTGLKVVITNAEPLLSWQKEVMEEAFGATVRESYGMCEMVAGASECSAGSLHLWPEAGYTEVLGDLIDEPVPDGKAGRLVCTGLLNHDMPLIRYEIGDRGSISVSGELCACGRRLPVLKSLEGRSSDILTTRGGLKVFWINPVFYGLPVAEAQIIQGTLDDFLVKVVPAGGFCSKTENEIRSRLSERLQGAEVKVKLVQSIQRGPNGKFQPVISHSANRPACATCAAE
jgi:phenylacetate-CoA ligase